VTLPVVNPQVRWASYNEGIDEKPSLFRIFAGDLFKLLTLYMLIIYKLSLQDRIKRIAVNDWISLQRSGTMFCAVTVFKRMTAGHYLHHYITTASFYSMEYDSLKQNEHQQCHLSVYVSQNETELKTMQLTQTAETSWNIE